MAANPESNPWDAEFPVVSYSESQERRRRQCARAHYHAVYTAHQGWDAPRATDAWLAYRLKKAVPLSAAIGTAVHAAATRCVKALVAGQSLPSFIELREEAGDALNQRWRNSRHRAKDFLRTPSRAPVYLESLYGKGPLRSELHRAAQKLDGALVALLRCEQVWDLVRSAAAGDVVLMDSFASMQVQGATGATTCYGAADLIVRPKPDAQWHIVDFKTGGADGVVDQIMTYALVARDALALSVDDGCVGIVVSLGEHPDEAVSLFTVAPEDLSDAQSRLNTNIAAVRALIANQITGEPRPLDAFPMTKNARNCNWCAYRALCHPDQLDPEAAIVVQAAAA